MKDVRQQKIKKINQSLIRIFRRALILPSLLWLCLCLAGHLSPDLMKIADFDTGEQRNPAGFPSGFSTNFFSKLEEYYNDRVPFRSILLHAGKELSALIESPYEKGLREKLIHLFYEEQSVPSPENEQTGSGPEDMDAEGIDLSGFFPPVVKNNSVILGRGDWLFLYGERNIDYYLADNLADEEELNNYNNAYAAFYDICRRRGKRLAILLIPDKTQVYDEYMPSYDVRDNYKRVQRLTDFITQTSDVPMAYPLSEMKAAKSEYRVYTKYDTHWNDAGAYIGYQALLKLLGKPLTSISALDITTEKYAQGDLILLANLSPSNYTNDLSYHIHYKPDIRILSESGREKSTTEQGIYRVTSTAENQEKVVLIGDSFRNALLQYACKDFADFTATHWKNLKTPEMDSEIEAADTIILVYVERDEFQLLDNILYITELLGR